MKRLIINADDFGIHPLVNEGIIEGHVHGVLTSTTLLASGMAFDDAVRKVKAVPTLGVGVHLCLVGALPPVSPVHEVSSLVDAEGLFYPSYGPVIKRAYEGKVQYEEVYEEWDRQIGKVVATGIPITHVDSHQHLHILPPFWKITVALMKKYKIYKVRIPRESYGFKTILANPFRTAGRTGLTFLAKKAAQDIVPCGLTTTQHFWGMIDGGHMNGQNLSYVLAQLGRGSHEIMMHPGRNTKELRAYFSFAYNWEEEYKALVSPAIKDKIKERKIELIHYGQL